jgi:hypothetical protein
MDAIFLLDVTCLWKILNPDSPVYVGLFLRPMFISIFALMALTNLQQFLIYAFSFSVYRPLDGCILLC